MLSFSFFPWPLSFVPFLLSCFLGRRRVFFLFTFLFFFYKFPPDENKSSRWVSVGEWRRGVRNGRAKRNRSVKDDGTGSLFSDPDDVTS